MNHSDSQEDATPEQTSGPSHGEETEVESGPRRPRSDDGPRSHRDRVRLFRRTALASLIGLGSLGFLGGTATGQGQGTRQWPTDVNANGNTLFDLGALELINGPRVGTTDDTALEGIVNDERFLEVAPTPTGLGPIIVAGHPDNTASQAAVGATIAGGGNANAPNEVTKNYAFIGGGQNNTASGPRAVIGGGDNNTASSLLAAVGGGLANEATGRLSTVGGGNGNQAVGERSTVGGGDGNRAAGERSTVGGGQRNEVADDNDYGTISGGEGNTVETGLDPATHGTVGGGKSNEVAGKGATVSGGVDNLARAKKSTIGGGENNVTGAEIGGGKGTTVGGGIGNEALRADTTVGGGTKNTAVIEGATVAGGRRNTAEGFNSTVGGGVSNEASGNRATASGGAGNLAQGNQSTIPGGNLNFAGYRSFAAGVRAKAASDETFVWNDGSGYHSIRDGRTEGLSSAKDLAGSGVTGDNTFHASASGGFRFITSRDTVTYIGSGSAGWSTTSTRAAKTNVDPVDPDEVLAGVDEMEVATWEYEDEDGDGRGVRHIGPMAEAFHEAVDVGDSDEHINSINADGVALAAIQGLSAKVEGTDDRIDTQQDHIDTQRERIDTQQDRIDELERENERLRERLRAVEERLSASEPNERSRASAND